MFIFWLGQRRRGLCLATSRWLSAQTISSPTVRPLVQDRWSLDTLQVDLNVRF